jgi:uncharacterized protein YegP (UPF0339 family)
MYYQYWQDNQNKWRWHLRAANHEIIAYGEAYNREQDCLHAISLVKSSKDAPVHKVRLS